LIRDLDDESGIPERNTLIKDWIPGQAQNDKKAIIRLFADCDTV
jgi:hypothetical protein